MTMTDPIADFLTRLRNANSAYHDGVVLPQSKMKANIAEILKSEGYAQASSSLQFVIKLNALTPTPDFYTKTDQWHVTLGDSDQDR